ncbi:MULTISPECIES: TMAO reductase system periplasmic protein TorT [unclassified Rhodococcus (in: high G+C Gram-positive bacteria)]|uniref:TMAO reductase system periplasmic protein TorT n=1 Tax=unclassified Rhodococcus (in: high G+C Gram-positive bacteria) TaxID=192944 RepID=UPI00233EEF82|nr:MULTISPECIES: TMAO reductase system periplasmic protein TorT [unclassified Rhodococcus (in: high G+C Gram-positive bacteria)]WSE25438.1 TMAO reductase system periplasmic protein TorT [Rhodococcus sp. PD04]
MHASVPRYAGVSALLFASALVLSACAHDTGATDRIPSADTSGRPWSVDALLTDCSAADVESSGCIGPNTEGTYTSLSRDDVSRPWRLCSVLPHMKDSTWIGVNYGQVSQARSLGVALSTSDAGGYANLSQQISQIEDCVSSGADAILLSAVSFDSLNNAVHDATLAGIPVIDVGNGVSSPEVAGHVLQDYIDMGRMIGEHLADLDRPLRVALLPGPAGAGWAERSVTGFTDAIEGSQVNIADVKYGDTGKEVQLRLIEDVLASNPDLDALVGNAVMAEAATRVAAERGLIGKLGIYSTYVTPELVDLIGAGRANCGPSEQSTLIGQMAVDYAIRILEDVPAAGDVERYAPVPMVACGPTEGDFDNIDSFDLAGSFAPSEFRPTFSVEGTQ